MSWKDHWKKREDGRYAYRDSNIDVTYLINEDLYQYLCDLTDEVREEMFFLMMSTAAETISFASVNVPLKQH